MKVRCQIIQSDEGYEGIITNLNGVLVYRTGQEGCAEDANGMMEGVIIRNGWIAEPPNE